MKLSQLQEARYAPDYRTFVQSYIDQAEIGCVPVDVKQATKVFTELYGQPEEQDGSLFWDVGEYANPHLEYSEAVPTWIELIVDDACAVVDQDPIE